LDGAFKARRPDSQNVIEAQNTLRKALSVQDDHSLV
jgi:hypothetical protein